MKRGRFEGWILVGWAALALGVLAALVLARWGAGDAGLRAGIRATARSSWALFLAVFVASPWHRLAPSSASKWLLRNRRYLGVSMALSQLVHALFIGALVALDRDRFVARLSASTAIGGLLGYVFLALMTATSFDRTAAWLGRRRWRILHTVGVYYLWIVFAFSFFGRALRSPAYWALVIPLVLAMALRVVAWRRRAARLESAENRAA